jgi:hypothetical protein
MVKRLLSKVEMKAKNIGRSLQVLAAEDAVKSAGWPVSKTGA